MSFHIGNHPGYLVCVTLVTALYLVSQAASYLGILGAMSEIQSGAFYLYFLYIESMCRFKNRVRSFVTFIPAPVSTPDLASCN